MALLLVRVRGERSYKTRIATRTRRERTVRSPVGDAFTSPFNVARFVRTPVFWGLVFGVANVVLPFGFWWLDLATVHALAIVLIAAVYIGFAVADGQPKVIAVETVSRRGSWSLPPSESPRPPGSSSSRTPRTEQRTSGNTEATSWQTRAGGHLSVRVDFLVAAVLAMLIVVGVDFH